MLSHSHAPDSSRRRRADSESRHPDAVEIFDCEFDRPWDVNYDNWPDNWRRTLGPGLPHYVDVDDRATTQSTRTIAASRSTSTAAAPTSRARWSPSPTTSATRSNAGCGVAGLKHAQVAGPRRVLRRRRAGAANRRRREWMSSHRRLGAAPHRPGQSRPTSASPRRGSCCTSSRATRADLERRGVASTTCGWRGCRKMTVATGSPCNVYTDKDDVEVTCELSGILDSDPDILFELLDASSQRLDGSRVQLEGRLITERRSKASEIRRRHREPAGRLRGLHVVAAADRQARLLQGPRHDAELAAACSTARVVNIALVPPLERPDQGRIRLVAGRRRHADVARRPGQAAAAWSAVNWVKMPVWYGEAEPERGDELVMFAEKLGRQRHRSRRRRRSPAGRFRTRPSGWPATPRSPTRCRPTRRAGCRCWTPCSRGCRCACGGGSWAPTTTPASRRLANLEASDRQAARQAVPLRPGREPGPRLEVDASVRRRRAGRRGSSSSSPRRPPLTGAGARRVPATCRRREHVDRWVLVEPLSRRDYDLETRARDLVEQMLAAKIHGADAIFAARPFDDDAGLMTEEGMPGELLLPWRTTASLLSGATLPRQHRAAAPQPQPAVRNARRRSADGRLERRADARRSSTWATTCACSTCGAASRRRGATDDRQVIDVAPHAQVRPRAQLARSPAGAWRSSSPTLHVPSVFGKAHANEIEIRNTFPQGVGGTVELVGAQGLADLAASASTSSWPPAKRS